MTSQSHRRNAGIALAAGGSLLFAFLASAGEDKLQMMDTNKDGMISAAEHSAGARQMFVKMDANGDGSVTATEMDAAYGQVKSGDQSAPRMSSAEKIRDIDGNKDGAITAVEHEAASRDKFAKMDTNRDGSLSAAELQAGHAALSGERTN